MVSTFPLGMEWIVAKQVTVSPNGNWAESSCSIGVCNGIAHCLMSACQPHYKYCTLASVLSWKEIISCMTSAVSCWLANTCWLMLLSQLKVASNVTKQLSVTPVCMGSCPPAIGPTLGARFGLSWVYHSVREEQLVLWAHSGGQTTQQICFGQKYVGKLYCQFLHMGSAVNCTGMNQTSSASG